MLINRSGLRAFNEYDLSATLEGQLKQIEKQIELDLKTNPPKDKLSYISEQVSKYQIKPLTLDKENITLTTRQEEIPAEYFPNAFFVDKGEYYEKEVLTFQLPFSGDANLLRCVPSTRILWTEEINVENNIISFDVINFNNDAESIKNKRNEVVGFLEKQAQNVNKQVDGYNQSLSKIIEELLNKITGKLSGHSQFLSQLGTPVEMGKSRNLKVALQDNISRVENTKPKKYDVFICHASEDKQFVSKLANALKKQGIEVWYDDFQLGWGDDLRPTIDNGLKNSLYGIVVFSKSFLGRKKWTEYELNGLFAREKDGKKIILPIWHDISREDLESYSPSLADRYAKRSSDSLEEIVNELKELIINNK